MGRLRPRVTELIFRALRLKSLPQFPGLEILRSTGILAGQQLDEKYYMKMG